VELPQNPLALATERPRGDGRFTIMNSELVGNLGSVDHEVETKIARSCGVDEEKTTDLIMIPLLGSVGTRVEPPKFGMRQAVELHRCSLTS
jgi:hypothetical protein